METNKRITWLDAANGYGILLVIFAHVDYYYSFLRGFIYTFHMPLFFFLSGYAFSRKESFGKFLWSKVKRIIIPYYYLGIPMILFDVYWQNRNKVVVLITVAGLVYYRLGGQPFYWNMNTCMTVLPYGVEPITYLGAFSGILLIVLLSWKYDGKVIDYLLTIPAAILLSPFMAGIALWIKPDLWNQYNLIVQRNLYGSNDVLPGLTGWVQIHGRDEITIKEKAKLDGYYVENQSLWLDIRSILMTVVSVLRHDGVREGELAQ